MVDIKNIPTQLKNTCKFCVWKFEKRSGQKTKMPYNPANGDRAKINDLRTFADFKATLMAYAMGGYLPYTKGAYKLESPTLYAEQGRLFRTRKTACEVLQEHMDAEDAEMYLWRAVEVFSNYPFATEKGLSMKYTVRGGEVFFNRKEKSVTKATVMKAFHQARRIQGEQGFVNGPKELGTFGASYLYPVFLRIGVCMKNSKKV